MIGRSKHGVPQRVRTTGDLSDKEPRRLLNKNNVGGTFIGF